MKVVAVVPMKLNNSRLPGKNTKSFHNGEPLCKYILRTLLHVHEIDEIYVYCSEPEISGLLPDGVKFLKRSEDLDQDTTSMTEILMTFTNEVAADIYVMTHVTAPFISAKSISKGVRAVISGKYDSAFAAKKLQDFLWKNGKPFNYQLDHIPRTQDLDVIYEETSGFYIYHRDVMNRLYRRIGENPCMIEVGEIEAVDIDEIEDFIIADAIYNYQLLIRE